MKKNHKIIGVAFTLAMPMFALAQGTTVEALIGTVIAVLGVLVPLLVAVAVVLFIWGVVQFVGSAGNEEARATGRQLMIWGVVGLAVIIAVWGFVNALLRTLDLNVNPPPVPQLVP